MHGFGRAPGSVSRNFSHVLEPLASRQMKPWTPMDGYMHWPASALASRRNMCMSSTMGTRSSLHDGLHDGLAPSHSLPVLSSHGHGDTYEYIGVTAW